MRHERYCRPIEPQGSSCRTSNGANRRNRVDHREGEELAFQMCRKRERRRTPLKVWRSIAASLGRPHPSAGPATWGRALNVAAARGCPPIAPPVRLGRVPLFSRTCSGEEAEVLAGLGCSANRP